MLFDAACHLNPTASASTTHNAIFTQGNLWNLLSGTTKTCGHIPEIMLRFNLQITQYLHGKQKFLYML